MLDEEEFFELNELKVGFKLFVKKDMGNGIEEIKAEILSVRKIEPEILEQEKDDKDIIEKQTTANTKKTKKDSVKNTDKQTEMPRFSFFIHYLNYNKRLDEWTDGSNFLLSNVEVPKKRKGILKQKRSKTNSPLICSTKSEKTKKKTSLKVQSPTIQPKSGNISVQNDPDKLEENKIKTINHLYIKDTIIETWYFSPYPEYIKDDIFICSTCLFYFNTRENLDEHICDLHHPPGNEIYRHDDISVFELDGHIQKNYCRNISLLSKCFLDHKTLFYDVDLFMFYVLCRYNPGVLADKTEQNSETDEQKYIVPPCYDFVGYFSKEKVTSQGYNLACVLVMPNEQRKGYSKLLIDFSYLLSKCENVIASPEKPLSDLGYLSYLSYWKDALEEEMTKSADQNGMENYSSSIGSISIDDLSKRTAILPEDIILTFNHYKMVKFYNGEIIFCKSDRKRSHKVYKEYLKWKGHCFNRNSLRLL